MTLKERITEDMKSAMRAGEKERLSTIRLALAAIKQREPREARARATAPATLLSQEKEVRV